MSVKAVRCNLVFFLLFAVIALLLGQNSIIDEITDGIILLYMIIVIVSALVYWLHSRQVNEWEKTLSLTMDSIHDVISIIDAEHGHILYISQTLKKILGYNPQDFLGKPVWELGPIMDHYSNHQSFMAFRDSLNEGKCAVPLSSVYQTRKADGTVAVLESTSLPLFKRKKVNRLIIISRDVTKRIEIEQALSISERKYRSIVENSSIPIVIYDRKGIITYVNRAVEDQTHLPAKRFLGTSYRNWVHSQDLPYVRKCIKASMSSPASYRCRVVLENNIVHFSIHQSSFYDENGLYQGSIVFAIDVDYAVKLTEKFKYQAQILDNIPEGVVVLNRERQIVYVNLKSRYLFNLSENSILNDEVIESSFGFSREEVETTRNCLLEHQIWQGEKSIIIDGQERAYLHRVTLLNGNNPPVVITSMDITEMVQTRKKAETANMAKSQFLANISHEIRTPMIGILGSVDLLENSALAPTQIENLQVIRECGEQLLSIINEILDLSKVEVGLVNLYPEPCNLSDVFNKTISMIEPMLMDKGLSISLDFDHRLPANVLLDHMKLRQILSNILYNAVKFTLSGGIHIKAHLESVESKSLMMVAVSDTGIGIPRDKIHSIFDPFTQVDNSSSRLYGGTGLGLYICRKLVELMNGKIWSESEEGLGTSIYFTLPLHPLEETPDSYTTGLESEGASTFDDLALEFAPVEILLVEDNPLNQKIVAQMLGNYGFGTTVVSNGLECLHILHRHHFDVILMDMQMPVMDGYEATRLIKSNRELTHIPVIAMTANSMTGDREKCLLCGCSDYIAKPFKSESLVQIIRLQLRNMPRQTISEDGDTDFILQLMPEFVAMLGEMMDDLRTAIEQRDLSRVQSISHDIKGTAGMYGLMSISQLAAQVEQNARDYAYQNISILIPRLAKLVQQASTLVS